MVLHPVLETMIVEIGKGVQRGSPYPLIRSGAAVPRDEELANKHAGPAQIGYP
jgi:hypothetical protein